MPGKEAGELRDTRKLTRLASVPQNKLEEEAARELALGLEAADSINDRTSSLFSRGHRPAFAGINSFLRSTYCEDSGNVGNGDACNGRKIARREKVTK